MTNLLTLGRDLTLPNYMNSLPQSVLDVLSTFPDACDRAIASGVSDNQLYIVSCLLDIKVIIPNGNLKPIESYPSHDGTLVFVKFLDDVRFKPISSKLALQAGGDPLNKSALYVNDSYVCDLEVEEVQTIGSSNVQASEEIHK